MTYPPPGNPDPFGQQQQPDPFAQQQHPDPFAAPPADPTSPPPPPPPAYDPYGQQPAPPSNPFTQPPPVPQNPYDPYAQQQSPAPQYGQPPAPYAPPYGATPQYPYGVQQADPNKQNGLAIGAMVTGIASILGGCCCPILGLAAGVAGGIMGFISRKQIAERGGQGSGMALAGIITGAVGVVLSIGNFILSLTMNQDVWQDIIKNAGNALY